jgi:DNA-binding GntR family transcriptional regulator
MTTECIWEALREMIMDGRLAGGIRLKEVELAEKFATSRTPIREALSQLQSEGLVDNLPNSVAMVKALDERNVEDAFQLRALLEGYGAVRAAQRLGEEQVRELERLCDEMEALHEGGRVAIVEVLELNDRFHRIVLEASENRRLTVALRATMEILRVYITEEEQEGLRERGII